MPPPSLRSSTKLSVPVWAIILIAVGSVTLTTRAFAQNRNVAGCLSIADVDQRVECLEGRSAQLQRESVGDQSQSRKASTAPSFDCRSSANAIERAICGDDLLSEWDAKMGKVFQQALKLQANKGALQESQRQWIAQRNRACGGGAEIAQSCLLSAIRSRISFLNDIIVREAYSAPIAAPVQSQAAPVLQSEPPPTAQPKSNGGSAGSSGAPPAARNADQSEGNWSIMYIVILGLATWAGLKVIAYLRRRQYLIAKYGKAIGLMILARQMWQGMTEEQLSESWGKPVEVSQEVVHRRVRETWKYGQTGKNRFRSRVYLENGSVIGWKRA